MPASSRALAIVAALGSVAQSAAQSPDNSFTLDLYAFAQEDDGGDPFRAEGFDYYAMRGALDVRLDEDSRFRLIANPAYLDNDPTLDLPPTILNGSTTSASGDLTTFDGLAKLDFNPEGSDWTVSPGVFYHHQIDYIGAGVDLDIARRLASGDANLKLSYSLRHDFLELNYWDRTYRGSDVRVTNNLQLSYLQNLSPSWKSMVGVQYSRQDGLLSDQHNYVTLFDTGGVPLLLVDEVLPNHRNRVQFNGRVRYSPATGNSVGLDASYYSDDWDIDHFAVQPSVDVGLGGGWSVRMWYRLTVQDQTRYFDSMPTTFERFRTQDSDLGDFVMHSPGVTLRFPLGGRGASPVEGSLTVYGFDRDDGIDGLGGKVQFVWQW